MNNPGPRNFSAKTAYDGTGYSGFQVQPNGPTIQGEIEKALAQVLGEEIRVHGASRTDAGVHAVGQVISFKSATLLPAAEIEKALNALLPKDIRVGPMVERSDDFHARFSAKGKRYVYRILNAERESPFLERYALWVRGELDLEKMKACAKLFPGERDFRSFTSRLNNGENPVKGLQAVEIKKPVDLLEIAITGSGFLYQMARRVAGAIHEAGKGELDLARVKGWLDVPEVGASKLVLPGKGLFLMEVFY